MKFDKCIYFSRSKPFVDSGGGGRRRTHQVFEALHSLGSFEFISSVTTDRRSKQKIRSRFRIGPIKNFVTGGEYKLWSQDRRVPLYRLRSISREWIKKIAGLSKFDLAVVEDPVYFKPLVIKLKKLGIPIVASCQNIESLSYCQESFKNQKIIFANELDTLALCDLAVTISREDSWLLNSFNIKTFYFPYFPPKQVQNRLLEIRRKRQKNKKRNIILLGNAGNIATRRSMVKAVEYWEKHNLSRNAGILWTAGYKTDMYLKDVMSYKGIEFFGPLPNDELDKKLAAAKACLCYQEEGGGALTRIGEMLLAGIPVLANTNAARSYYNMKGVIEFQNLHHLEKALAEVDRFADPIPEPVEPDPSLLAAEIKKIISEKHMFDKK